jgi:predicted metal-dependent peptidase
MSKAPTTATKSKNKSFKNDVFDAVADQKARDAILGARVALVLKHGFFGNLAMRLRLVAADEWLETAATDGRHFYYNSKFINMLNTKQMMFLFCHELLHCAYDHMSRTGDRNRMVCNIAMDYVVNADCINNNLGERITQVPILYDRKYEGWHWEAVYDDLMKNVKQVTLEEMAEMLLDDHLDADGEGEDGKDGDKEGKGGRPKLSDEERKQIRDEFKEAMLSAAQAAGAGNLPGGLKRLLKDLTEPKIDWREFIQQQIQSTVKNDYTYAIPSKKNFQNGFSMPSMIKEDSIEVCIALDTSGSITDEMARDFFSEVKGIMDTFTDYKLNIWCWDTSVHNPQEFTPHGNDDLMEYEIAGFGGTDSAVNWSFMKANDISPKLLIVFTDGEIWGDWGDPDYCDTVWIINNRHNKTIEPTFGRHAYYEND